MSESPKPERPSKAFTVISLIATDFAVCVIGGVYLGKWLDSLWGTTPWLLLTGIFVGMIAGVLGILEITKRYS